MQIVVCMKELVYLKKTSPDSAMFCEYYQDKYVDGIVQDLLRLPKQSENEIIDEEKSNSSNHITYRYAYRIKI